jgi:hypothetical protein
VVYRLTSVIVSVLLVGTTLWGGCASCSTDTSSQQQEHSCCARHQADDCGMPAPEAPVQKQRPCPEMMLAPEASQAVTPLAVDLVAPPAVIELPAEPVAELAGRVDLRDASQHSPPDIYLLNATLLI